MSGEPKTITTGGDPDGDCYTSIYASETGIVAGGRFDGYAIEQAGAPWSAVLEHAPPGALVKALSGHEGDREAMEALERVRVELSRECRRSLRAAIAARDQLLGEKSDEIRWLRGEVSKMIGKLTPIAIAETSGAGLKGPVGPVPAPEDDEYGGVGPK